MSGQMNPSHLSSFCFKYSYFPFLDNEKPPWRWFMYMAEFYDVKLILLRTTFCLTRSSQRTPPYKRVPSLWVHSGHYKNTQTAYNHINARASLGSALLRYADLRKQWVKHSGRPPWAEQPCCKSYYQVMPWRSAGFSYLDEFRKKSKGYMSTHWHNIRMTGFVHSWTPLHEAILGC